MSQLAERSVADAGLCLSDFSVLEALLHKGPLTINEIQAKVLLASGSMTAAVDRMESKGLLIRKSAAKDRRAKVLELTGEGNRAAEIVFRTHTAALEAFMTPLRQNQRRRIYPMLKKLGLFAADLGVHGGQGQPTGIENRRNDVALLLQRRFRALPPIPPIQPRFATFVQRGLVNRRKA